MVGTKPEDWRILTPIFSMMSPIIVGVMGWFLNIGYMEQKEFNQSLIKKIDKYIEIQASNNLQNEERWAKIRYGCCSELRRVDQ